ncbi:DUF1128 family protein [Bacillaceae bacterium SIJ1]|uniref:DUF1128 family protein n=1 Tax=Litoribacterium kuwaitense TaxID=1398745 RepID=UPI0013EA063D|nr:DUF1128 family protein [Litoribacterium kuwaitense]NGP44156.1 DUF1128 family protein [Litoribacterium kuwaitense]
MNYSEPNEKNLSLMLTEIAQDLQVVNTRMLDASDYDLQHYDTVKDVYDMVKRTTNLSVSDREAILQALSSCRKK